jgi:hypothetical protein
MAMSVAGVPLFLEAQRGAVGRNPSGILAKYVEKLLPSRIELP